MRVFLINQVSVERENSGGAMFNHRILFADLHPETEAKIDASNPHAVAQKMLPACLGGGEKRPGSAARRLAFDLSYPSQSVQTPEQKALQREKKVLTEEPQGRKVTLPSSATSWQ
eukprot:g16568.t1